MRLLLTIISLFTLVHAAHAQQDAFSLRLGPEIGAGIGHQWGNDIDYNNGLLAGGLMFEGRMADAWGWALRPAYARSVALDSELGSAFGEHRFQLLTGPVWRADNGRSMRAYARTAPFIRLLGGAMAHTDINRRNLLPMAELGFGLKFRLNDRNDLEVALAAQGAGTSQENLQLAGMLSLAYHINFKERKIKFRSPPLNLVPRTTETEVTRTQPSWEAPLLPARSIEWSPQPNDQPKKGKMRKKQQPKDEDTVGSPTLSDDEDEDEPTSTEAVEDTPAQTVTAAADLPQAQTPSAERTVTDTDTATAKTTGSDTSEKTLPATTTASEPIAAAPRTDTVIKVVEVAVPTQPAAAPVASAPDRPQQPQPTAPAQAPQPVVVEVRTTQAQPASQVPAPVATASVPYAPANDDAIERLARQQEQMMLMLQQLTRSVEMLSKTEPAEVSGVRPASIQPATSAAPTSAKTEEDDLRAQLTRITEEMAKMAERMNKMEQHITQPPAALGSATVAVAPIAPAPKPQQPPAVVTEPVTQAATVAQAPVKDASSVSATAAPSAHEVQFARNSYGLNAEQAEVIGAMAARALADPGLIVIVEGYADRSGPADFNAIIARKRANEVLYELKKLGVPIAQTVFASYGDERSMDDPSYRKVVVRLMRAE